MRNRRVSLLDLSQAASILPAWARRPLHHAAHFAVGATMPKIDVAWVCGRLRDSGDSARLLVVGELPWSTYLPERLLCPGFETQSLGKVRTGSLPQLIDRHREAADLVCVRMDKISARLLLGPEYLALPESLASFVELPEELESYLRGNSSRCSDMRRLRRDGFTYEIAHSPEDLDAFYRDFHVPHVHRRFGEHARIARAWQWRCRLPKGGVLWVVHRGRRVAGTFFLHEPKSFRLVVSGRTDDVQGRAGFAGIYAFAFMHAHALGFRHINMGGCRANLQDGVFRYKRKWGARFSLKPDQYFDLHLSWQRYSPAVRELLLHHPLTVHRNGGLAVLAALPAKNQTASAAIDLRIKGFERTFVVADGAIDNLPQDVTMIDMGYASSSRELLNRTGRVA